MTSIRETCHVGIVFAVAVEADAFERLAADRVETRAAGVVIHEGSVAGVRVSWCVAGAGRMAAARAARLLIDGHRPRLIVSAGFAGGLDPALPRGAVVRPSAVVVDDPSRPLPLAAVGLTDAASAGRPRIVTVDAIVATPAAKRTLAARSGAGLVDMETHAVAEEAAGAGLPCAAVRVISDGVDDELPPEVAALALPQSAMRRLGAALGAVGRRPRAALDLWRLYEHAVIDGRSLAAALAELCATAATV